MTADRANQFATFLGEDELVRLVLMAARIREAVADNIGTPLYFGDIEVRHPDGYTLGWFVDISESGHYDFAPKKEPE